MAAADFRDLNWRPAVPAGKTKKREVRAEKPLTAYAGKRDFIRTPEPAGSNNRREGREFVVQKHAARRLHYDLFKTGASATKVSVVIPRRSWFLTALQIADCVWPSGRTFSTTH
jgi:hypothetical protein